ncbi:hypothetical protein Q3G72_017126 [Acer saccharum]|nr:hypothetical protein Q3G72_017126 [Acer saccharum]
MSGKDFNDSTENSTTKNNRLRERGCEEEKNSCLKFSCIERWIYHRAPQMWLLVVVVAMEWLKTLGLLHQLSLTVSSFNAASQLPLLQRLNSLVTELDNMVKLSEKCNIEVPMEVLNLIDDGKNPDEFTRDVINSCIAKNQVTKGRTDSFKSLRKHLLEELEQAFPDEVESYREIRASSAAETKRLAQSQSMLPNGDVKVKPEI